MKEVERALVLVVRFQAVILFLALPFSFFPTEWMSAMHESLGLGNFPHSPLVEYLTRSLSALYACWAPLYLFLSLDVRRFLPLVAFLAVIKGLYGVGMFGLDLWVGQPLFWTAVEGPGIMAVSAAQYLLARRLQQEAAPTAHP